MGTLWQGLWCRTGGVVGLDVKLEGVRQAVVVEEAHHSLGVVVVLVLGRLTRLGLDKALCIEANAGLVVVYHVKERSEVIELLAHCSVHTANTHVSSRRRPCHCPLCAVA